MESARNLAFLGFYGNFYFNSDHYEKYADGLEPEGSVSPLINIVGVTSQSNREFDCWLCVKAAPTTCAMLSKLCKNYHYGICGCVVQCEPYYESKSFGVDRVAITSDEDWGRLAEYHVGGVFKDILA